MLLFTSRQQGYFNFRIPALVCTARGSLLAFCSARYGNGDDWAASDLVMRRRPAGQAHWEAMVVLAANGEQPHDNAVPIATRAGKVHLLYSVNSCRLFYRCSEDDGVSFGPACEVTEVLEGFRPHYDWNVAVPSPGHGLELTSGRLLLPVWLSTGGLLHRPSAVATVYSDDGGETWQCGELVVQDSPQVKNPSESTLMEVSSGQVLLSIRNETAGNRRLLAVSPTGIDQWQWSYGDLPEPVCMASSLRLHDGRLLHLAPDPDTTQTQPWYGRTAPLTPHDDTHAAPRVRQRLTLYASQDQGQTWWPWRVVESGMAGYSDLTQDQAGKIHVLYEKGALEGNMFDPQGLEWHEVNS